MASPESALLSDLYTTWMSRMAANPTSDIAVIRDMFEEWHTVSSEPRGVTYEDADADGVRALWAIPPDTSNGYFLYFHGGGYTAGSPHSHRKLAGHLAKASGRRVLVIDYRLAPEAAFPAPLEDCEKAFEWLVTTTGAEPGRIAVGGDSAGGNLTLSLAVARRDRGAQVPLGLVLFSPFVDLEGMGATVDSNRLVDVMMPDDPAAPSPVHAAVMAYLQGKAEPSDPRVNALHADLTGLPPIYVAVGSSETLLDDSQRLAERARAAGVDVTLSVVEGQQHVFPLMAGRAPEADQEIAAVGQWLQKQQG